MPEMIRQPYFTLSIPLSYEPMTAPAADLFTAEVLTTSRAISACVGEMHTMGILESFCKRLIAHCIHERCSVLTMPLAIREAGTPATPTPEEGAEECILLLSSLTSCTGMIRLHFSAWDSVYESAAKREADHFRHFTLDYEDGTVTLVTLSDRIMNGLTKLRESERIHEWVAKLYPTLRHPMSIALDPEFAPDTTVVVTKSDRTAPGHDTLHVATNDGLLVL